MQREWYDYTFERGGRQVDSYWKNPQGVDRGEPSRGIYAVHVLVGHHGIFSLTPVWLLSIAGTVVWMWRGRERAAALVGGGNRGHHAGMPGVLFGPRASQPQLWRSDQRFAVDVLVGAVVAADDVAGGGWPGSAALDPRLGPGAVGPLRSLGQLSNLESLDPALVDELHAVSGLGVAMVAPVTEVNLSDPIAQHMRTDLARLRVDSTVGEALGELRQSPPPARIVYFYVVDDDGRLKGVMPARALLLSPPETRIAEIMLKSVIALPADATVLDACEFFVLHRFLAFPVVDRRTAIDRGDRRGTVHGRAPRPGRGLKRRLVSTRGRPPRLGPANRPD